MSDIVATLRRLLGRMEPWMVARKATLPQTAGRRIAEQLFRKLSENAVGIYPAGGPASAFAIPEPSRVGNIVDVLRETVAAAIDKAIADDRAAADDINAAGIAAERERCAKVLDRMRTPCVSTMDSFARIAAAAIRCRP